MKRLTTKGQERLFSLMSHAYDIYNAFAPGEEGEQALLKLRDEVRSRMDASQSPTTPMKLELPLGLVGYMMAASKHLGDMCLAVSQMNEAGTLFER